MVNSNWTRDRFSVEKLFSAFPQLFNRHVLAFLLTEPVLKKSSPGLYLISSVFASHCSIDRILSICGIRIVAKE